jgi:hypothetical protein
VVFARSADAVANGGLPQVDRTFGFGLTNSSSGVFIGVAGTVLDAVTWTSAMAGWATAVDPGKATPSDNDDLANWCDATVPYGAGDLGTPGAVNGACVIAGTCQDGAVARAPVPPVAGDLVITELMANPNVVTDTDGEWFEILATRDVDLNGLELGRTPPTVDVTVNATTCLRVTAGSHVLLARNADMLQNGGLPTVDHVVSISLVNTNGSLFAGHAGAVLDQVTWTNVTAGASTSLDPDFSNPTDNDLPTSFCPGAAPYGTGTNLGSPRAANPQCP